MTDVLIYRRSQKRLDDLHKNIVLFLCNIVKKNIDFRRQKSKIKKSKNWSYRLDRQKGGSETNSLTEVLKEELNCRTVFTIPIGNGIPVFESVVVTWVIMAVLVVLSLILTRNLKVMNPGKKQLLLEAGIDALRKFFRGILGEEGDRYIPYMMTVIIFLGVSNVSGIFGVKPPTKDLNVTLALALMSMFLIEYCGIYKKGLKGFFKSFLDPIPVMLPMNIMEVFIRPTALCFRLFGNILGGFVVMALVEFVCPAILPIPFSLYFDFFDGFIQAYIFVFLTSMFMSETMD